jgi:hypothetical protein
MSVHRNRKYWALFGAAMLAVGLATAAQVHDKVTSDYRCDQNWPGPAIVLRGVVLPLPSGYALIDRTSQPHIFRNFAAVMVGGDPGQIFVGFTPNHEEWVGDENELRSRSFMWNDIRREQLVHLPTGREQEAFFFADGVMMRFSGVAIPFSELVASCYLELLPMTVDMNQSSLR